MSESFLNIALSKCSKMSEKKNRILKFWKAYRNQRLQFNK